MKKTLSILLAGCLFLTSSVSAIASETNQGGKNETVASAQNVVQKQATLPEVMERIEGISKMLEDGRMIVNGVNEQGEHICGWMNQEGVFEEFNGGYALYPLENDSYLIGAEDTASSVLDLSNGGAAVPINDAGIHAVIFRDNHILYEQEVNEPYQKMYRIDGNHILVLAAHEENGSVVLEGGELDASGNWLIPMGTELTDACKLASFLEPVMDEDGYHWSFADNGARYLYKSVNYQDGNSTTLQFVDVCTSDSPQTSREQFNMTFSSKMECFMMMRSAISNELDKAVFDEIDSQTYLFHGGKSADQPNAMMVMTTASKNVFFADAAEPVEVLGCVMLQNEETMVFYSPAEAAFYRIQTQAFSESEKTEPQEVPLVPSMTENITGTPVLADTRIVYLTKDSAESDTASALTVVDLTTNQVSQMAIKNLPADSEGILEGDTLILVGKEGKELKVVDLAEGRIKYSFEAKSGQTFSDPKVLGDTYMAFLISNEQGASNYNFLDPANEPEYVEPWEGKVLSPQETGLGLYSQVINAIEKDSDAYLKSGFADGILYDLDDDGIPELIVNYAKYFSGAGLKMTCNVFNLRDGEVVELMKEEQVCTLVAAQHGSISILEKDGQKTLCLLMEDSYDDAAGKHFFMGEWNNYVLKNGVMTQIESASYYYEHFAGTTQINEEKTKVTLNDVETTLDAYQAMVDSYETVMVNKNDFSSFTNLYNQVLNQEAQGLGQIRQEESQPENSSSLESSQNENSEENSSMPESSQNESKTEESSTVISTPVINDYSDDELVNYAWNKRNTANSKWDYVNEIPTGTEYLGQIHFTREDGTYINYVVFRQYGSFKGQSASFIWWARRGSISGMMEARDSGLLYQVPGLSSYYSYYGVSSLSEFYYSMLINEINKGYTMAYCSVAGLPG